MCSWPIPTLGERPPSPITSKEGYHTLRDIIEEIETKDIASWYGARVDDTKRLLEKHAPVLRFEDGEKFFPMSALLYLVCSTIWHIPVKPRADWGGPRSFDLLRTSPHIQLEIDLRLESMRQYRSKGDVHPGIEECVDLVEVEERFANSPGGYPDQVRESVKQVVQTKLDRLHIIDNFVLEEEEQGLLALHFADSIRGWWLWSPRLWLPKDTEQKAKEKSVISSHEKGRMSTTMGGWWTNAAIASCSTGSFTPSITGAVPCLSWTSSCLV